MNAPSNIGRGVEDPLIGGDIEISGTARAMSRFFDMRAHNRHVLGSPASMGFPIEGFKGK